MKNGYLRRQFLLTDQKVIPFDGWITCATISSYLHYHPDLPVSQLRSKDAALTFVGYAIDPERPELSDSSLLQDLFHLLPDMGRLIDRAQALAGRWILFVESPAYSIALHDACGLRRMYYSAHSSVPRFCASEALTAARVLELEEDQDAVAGFGNTNFAQTHPEYWWPGDATQFKNVRALLPNHYLDLRTRETVRYGLRDSIGALSLRDSAVHSAKHLSGLIRGIGMRHELALAITAGWDSRTLLAGCRAASLEPHCYTLRFGAMTQSSQDIAVPARMLAQMQCRHHVIDCTLQPTHEFRALYKSNTDPAHDEACQLAFGLSKHFPQQKVTLSGHCSEIARNFYRLQPGTEITPTALAAVTGMDPTRFVLDQFDRWLADARPASEACGIGLMDLFYWEQRVGRWAANGQGQWDMVHERFTPFNCRKVLFTLLAAPQESRQAPHYRLYRKMIENLSPSLLSEPINPDTARKPPEAILLRGILQGSVRRLKHLRRALPLHR